MEKKPTGKKILFVDDEIRWTTTYVEELQAEGYEVHQVTNVDNALQFFQKNRHYIALLILDLMMPPGSSFTNEETHIGMRTGVCFYDTIRQMAPKLYVIILTNVSDEKVKERFDQERYCTFLRKPETFPYELAEQVRAAVKG